MEGVSIVETKVLNALIMQVEDLKQVVLQIGESLTEARRPYMNTKEVCDMLGKSENWVLLHKNDIGCSKRTGTLIFKRKDVEDFVESDYFRKETRNRRKAS